MELTTVKEPPVTDTPWRTRRTRLPRLDSRGVSLLVLAVSRTSVVLAADQIYIDLNTHPPTWRTNFTKVFEGKSVVAGIVGTTHTHALRLPDVLTNVTATATDLENAVKSFLDTTTTVLPAAVAEWRQHVGNEPQLDDFATVLIGGLFKGEPAFVELTCTDTDDTTRWTVSDLIFTEPATTYVGAYGAVAPEVVRRTSTWGLRGRFETHWDGQLVGRPIDTPPADAPGAELAEYAKATTAAGIADEKRVTRPTWWPTGIPVAAGAPVVAGLQFTTPPRTPTRGNARGHRKRPPATSRSTGEELQ